jgi:hypothetical protein
MVAAFPITVVQYHIEASGHRDYKLMECSVRMPASVRATGYIVEVIYSLDLERNVPTIFDKCQVAPWIMYFR